MPGFDGLIDLIPDPLADDNLLAENDAFARQYAAESAASSGSWDSFGLASTSGSDLDWQAPGAGAADWYSSDFDLLGAGGGEAGAAAGMGAGVDPASFQFDQLKSEDWSDQLVSEVGEGNSFRREQRERYGAPLLNMTNLAHASEEDLLMGAEAQALRDDKVDAVMQEAMRLHHLFFEKAHNRYAIAVRFGELIEEIEYDDWNLPLEGEEQGVPSWCRAAFAMRQEYDALNERTLIDDQVRSAQETAFFEDGVSRAVAKQMEWADLLERGASRREEAMDASSALEQMMEGVLPGATDDFEHAFGEATSEPLVDDLLTRANKLADAEYWAALEGALEEDELGAVPAAVREGDEEEEEEEGEEAGAGDQEERHTRRGPHLGAAHSKKVQAAADDRERHKAELMGLSPMSGRAADPLLDLLDRHDQAS